MKLKHCLIFLFISSVLSGSCDFSADEQDKTTFNVAMRVADAITEIVSFITSVNGLPFLNPLNPLLWLISDLWKEDPKFPEMMDCKIRKYHKDRIVSYLLSFDHQISQANSSVDVLKNIRGQLESSDVIGEIKIQEESMKAAVFPILNSWAYMHFKLYRLLIAHGEPLQEKHDLWVIFYAQLILRYWRPYKNQLIRDFTGEYKYRYKLDNLKVMTSLLPPAESILKTWNILPYKKSYRKKVESLLDSCKVRRVLPVMFRYLWTKDVHTDYGFSGRYSYMTFDLNEDPQWLSCSQGVQCVHKPCPDLTGPNCFTENFSLYSKHKFDLPLSSGAIIKILNTNGNWLVTRYDGHKDKFMFTGHSNHFQDPLKMSTLQNWLKYKNSTNWYLSKSLDSSILDNLYMVQILADLNDYALHDIDSKFVEQRRCISRNEDRNCYIEIFGLHKMKSEESQLYDGNIVFFNSFPGEVTDYLHFRQQMLYYEIYVHGAETTKVEVPNEPSW